MRIYQNSKLRMPLDQIAADLGLSKDYLIELSKKDDAVRNSIARGVAKSSKVMRRTLAERALGLPEREVDSIVEQVDKKTGKVKRIKVKTKLPPVPGDNRMLEFFLRSQEGYRTTERVELTGADGVPIGEMTDEQADAALQAIIKRMNAKTDGDPTP